MTWNYLGASSRVGTEEQWGIQIDCDLHGCDPHHGDNGRVYMEPDEATARESAPHGINGHTVRLVTRLVDHPEWADPVRVDESEAGS